jgi:hypothetical protein
VHTIKIATVAALACASCQKYSWYGYQYRMHADFSGGEEPEPANAEARQLLANAKTVAFFPPDVCLNIDPDVSQKRVQELRASCGVLLSTLERAAERAGYEVLSWQNLRGTKRPIEYAREANVDVLFEINQFELGTLDDSQVERSLGFFVRDDDGREAPLQVSSALAEKCARYAAAAEVIQPVADTGTIDIKTVSVADGRARWRYRKTLSESRHRTYPQVTFIAAHRSHWAENVLGATALLAASAAGGLLLAEVATDDDPATPEDENFDSGGWSTKLFAVGAVAAGTAVGVHFALGTKPPPPERILCESAFAAPSELPASVAPSGPIAAKHTFQEQKFDVKTRAKERIRDTMIKQFIEVLKDVHAGRPEAPAPTFAPAAAPATPPAR